MLLSTLKSFEGLSEIAPAKEPIGIQLLGTFFFWELLEYGHRLTGSHALNFPNYNHHIHFYLQDNAKVGEVGVFQEDAHEHFEFSTKRDLEGKDKNSCGNLLTHPSSLWHLCPRQPPARMDHGLCSMSLHFHTAKKIICFHSPTLSREAFFFPAKNPAPMHHNSDKTFSRPTDWNDHLKALSES